ncbi:DedA family protein [Lolliginicoccus suaedae]|uniref:DedA family protein n=1 Tax=Lolliginicoccus suaedae TaxID=2605429 RepID=UPI0011F055A8|nr:VTT domain-containing protein [Lolliginicoccus suaedae]
MPHGDGGSIAGLFETLGGQPPGVVALILCGLLIIQTTFLVGLLLPGDLSLVLAGMSVSGPAEWLIVVGGGVVGCVLGASGSYVLGSRWGPGIRRSRLGRVVGEKRWSRAESYLQGTDGGPTIMVAVFIPVVFALTPFTAGALRVPYLVMIRWWSLGSLGWVAIYVTLGAVAGELARRYPGWSVLFVTGTVVLIVLLAGTIRHKSHQSARPQ